MSLATTPASPLSVERRESNVATRSWDSPKTFAASGVLDRAVGTSAVTGSEELPGKGETRRSDAPIVMQNTLATASASTVLHSPGFVNLASRCNLLRRKEGFLREGVRFWTIRWIAKVRGWPPRIGFAGQGSFCDCRMNAAARRRWKVSGSKTGFPVDLVRLFTS